MNPAESNRPPLLSAMEEILRYETKLERLQRMRRGEAVPAPFSVDVSDRGER